MPLPLTARVNDRHHLEIGGCDLAALADEFGTPLYVFDEAHLRARAHEAVEVFRATWQQAGTGTGEPLILYATKAYFSSYLARLYKDLGLGLDVTSEGELEIARRVGYPCERIYLHGNNKTRGELRAALALGAEQIVVDNLDEIDLLDQVAGELDARPRVLLRLAPAIDPHTHRFLATGVAESKFGLPLATGAALEGARRVQARAPRLRLVGLHIHIGSQVFEVEPYRQACAAALDFAAELQRTAGFELQELDLGGGWGVGYDQRQPSLAVDEVARAIADCIRQRWNRSPKFRLIVEPGRALVAEAAVALYTVGAIKEITGVRTYVSVDGGMGDNIRPALYGARYSALLANKADDPAEIRVAVAGRYCEQGDILIEEVALPRTAVGDLIAVPVAGAYQLPMANNYNLIPRPAVLAVRGGSARVIRRRENTDDMLRCETDA